MFKEIKMEITTIALLRTWYASPIKMSVLLCSVGVHIICNKVCIEFKKTLSLQPLYCPFAGHIDVGW